MAELLKSITDLNPLDIKAEGRLRPVSRAGVETIKASILELGTMKDRIHVRKKHSGEIVLLAGLHRLTAAIELEWKTVPVVAWKCNDDWARMMEIDDNLAGAELNALDTAVFLAERKRVYEKLHPETKAGIAGGLARQNSANDMMSFAETTAEKFGLSKRHVERIVAAGTALADSDIDTLRKVEKPVTLADLQTLAKIGDPKQRSKVCDALAKGTAQNAAKALSALSARVGDKARSDADKKYRKLADAFARCGKPARRRFVEEHADELRELLDGMDQGGAEVVPFIAHAREVS